MTDQNITIRQKIQSIEISESKLEQTIEQVQSLILMLEATGSEHPQYFRLGFLNETLQEKTNELNQLNKTKNRLRSEIKNG